MLGNRGDVILKGVPCPVMPVLSVQEMLVRGGRPKLLPVDSRVLVRNNQTRILLPVWAHTPSASGTVRSVHSFLLSPSAAVRPGALEGLRYSPVAVKSSSKLKPRWDLHLPWVGNGAGILGETLRPLIAGRWAAALDLLLPAGQPVEEVSDSLLYQGLVPKHRFPVASSLAHPQTASSALKSGLYPGRFTSLNSKPGVRRYSRTASPRCVGALSQITSKPKSTEAAS